MSYTEQTFMIIKAIKRIPYGKVDTYGGVALKAGYPGAARQVVRVLCTLSEKESLPWYRVVNRFGGISLKGTGGSEQAMLLECEGITLSNGRIDLGRYHA